MVYTSEDTNLDPEYNTRVESVYCVKYWKVNNTLDFDGRFYFPSHFIPSDDPTIQATALKVITDNELANASTYLKCFALMNYVDDLLSYDYSAYFYRYPQDALSILKKPTSAVCAGYTTLFCSLVRSIGLKAKEVRTDTHAWAKVYDPSTSTWVMVDPLWCDTGNPAIHSSAYFFEVDGARNHPIETRVLEGR
jgi:transglutaminase-like putative cysteine protease